MDSCEYKEILTDAGIRLHGYDKSTWKPLMRQTIINLGVCCAYFMLGIFFGAPTVIVAQVRSDVNSTEVVTDELLSWLTSNTGISSVPFVVILPLVYNKIGRKLTFLLVWLCILTGFIGFYISKRLYYVVISEIFVGVPCASIVTFGPILISEYTSPQYRGIFLTLKSASIFWGIWVSNAVGTFFPWKSIAIIPFVCSVYIISMIIWPESPYWLAMKGRFVESAKSHRWLKGINENSEKELATLISSQKIVHNLPLLLAGNNNQIYDLSKNIWITIKSRSFYKPLLLCLILFAQYQFTGKLIISMYAMDVLKQIVQDESYAYIAMLVLDGVTVFSMYVGCILSRYFKRRILLLSCSAIGIVLLLVLSLHTYLVSLSILTENPMLIILLLSSFSIIVGCGPMILPTSVYGEIISTRHQELGMILVGLGATTSMSLLLKFSPFMFKTFKIHGCFLFYAIFSTIFLTIIYIYLPETKDKTIHEIEQYFTKNKLPVEPKKSLLHTES